LHVAFAADGCELGGPSGLKVFEAAGDHDNWQEAFADAVVRPCAKSDMAVPAQNKHALALVREEEVFLRMPQQAVRCRSHRAQPKTADRVFSEIENDPVGLEVSLWCGTATEAAVDAQSIGMWRRLACTQRRNCRFVADSCTRCTWAAYSRSVCIHASALNKEPLMTPSRRVMLSALTIALAGKTLSTTRGLLPIAEATRDVAP
jgi:hypothetical protein